MSDTYIYESHSPNLKSGTYKVSIAQDFKVDEGTLAPSVEDVYFKVDGEQYSLSAQQVDSVYPPASAVGNFDHVLPHIILNRSTLPWERAIGNGMSDKPWLALFLFTEEEVNSVDKFKKMNVTQSSWEASGAFNPIANTNPNSNSFSSIHISADLLDRVLPSVTEIATLAHVRGQDGKEKAVVVGSRMPAKGRNVIHLISLEKMYTSQGYTGKVANGMHGFVSLRSWEFFCNDHFIITGELLDNNKSNFSTTVFNALKNISGREFFNKYDLVQAVKVEPALDAATRKSELSTIVSLFEVANLSSILTHLDWKPVFLQLNDTPSDHGYTQLKYKLSLGTHVDAIYKGPLVPDVTPLNAVLPRALPIGKVDDLLFLATFKNAPVVDVSYASAWELGRLLALKDKNFSTALFQWKRACHQLYKTINKYTGNHPISPLYPAKPPSIETWFKDLAAFKNVPFNYLVPLETYLPFQSIRFFNVDTLWMRYLVDGAFSIGRISENDRIIDKDIYESAQNPYSTPVKCGFFLRSTVVSGWPNLTIEIATEENGTMKNAEFNRTNISSDLLACFSDSQIDQVTFYQKMESVHFGFEENAGDPSKLFAVKKDGGNANVAYDKPTQKVNIDKLKTDMGTINVAEFASLLVQKVDKVTFTIT